MPRSGREKASGPGGGPPRNTGLRGLAGSTAAMQIGGGHASLPGPGWLTMMAG